MMRDCVTYRDNKNIYGKKLAHAKCLGALMYTFLGPIKRTALMFYKTILMRRVVVIVTIIK